MVRELLPPVPVRLTCNWPIRNDVVEFPKSKELLNTALTVMGPWQYALLGPQLDGRVKL